MVIAIIVVLAAVVYVAMGRGGELSVERNDYVPLDLGPVSATDVALLRPPTGMWGYNMQVTDEAMEQVAESIRERDVRIVALEQLVTDLSRDHAPRCRCSPARTSAPGTAGRRPAPRRRKSSRRRATPPRPATEPARLPFDPPRPSGDFTGPPERSHD